MKKSQHYIWRNYLKPWTINNKIWCKRYDNIFNPSLVNIGQENYFYEAIPLNSDELLLLNIYINSLHATARKTIQSMLEIYINSSCISEVTQKEGIEEYHTLIEGKAIKSLSCLQQGDISFFDIEQEKLNFCTYIGFQYSRTDKIRQNLIRMFDNPELNQYIPKTIRPDIYAKAMALLTADTIGNWAYSEASILLLKNTTDIPFITGDQPIINLKSNNFDMKEPPTEMKLYYPISPSKAIILSNNRKGEDVIDDKSKIIFYNKQIHSFSNNQIYASHKTHFTEL